jgi:Rieske Fe-S protein
MCDGSCALSAAGAERVAVELAEPHCAGGACAAGDGVSRRTFISRSTLAAVAAVLASACGDGIIGGSGPTAPATLPTGGLILKLSDYPALATVGAIVRVDTASGPLAVVHGGATTYMAFSMICPHQGTTINIQGSGFVCPNHGARFDASGTWTGGQATSNLAAFTVLLDATAGTLNIGGVGSGPAPGPGQQPPPQQPGSGSINLVVDLTKFPALATVGGVARVDGGTGTPVGAVRVAAAQFAAYTLACTHQGTTVNLSGKVWTCPNHGAQFDASGRVTRGPANTNLAALTAAYDAASNKLTITGTAPSGGGGRGRDDD